MRRRQITLEFEPSPETIEADYEDIMSGLWTELHAVGAHHCVFRLTPVPEDGLPDDHYVLNDKTITVAELKEILETAEPGQYVVFDDGGSWYKNVGEVVVPGEDREAAEFVAVTLLPGRGFDPRQI